MTAIQQFDKVLAVFAPKRTDDLRPGFEKYFGQRLSFRAEWYIDEDTRSDGAYAGQLAMYFADYEHDPELLCGRWVPECDLSEVEIIGT